MLLVVFSHVTYAATIVLTMSNLEGEEVFEASNLGYGSLLCSNVLHIICDQLCICSVADEVVQERICDDELILINKPKVSLELADKHAHTCIHTYIHS